MVLMICMLAHQERPDNEHSWPVSPTFDPQRDTLTVVSNTQVVERGDHLGSEREACRDHVIILWGVYGD